MNDKESDMSSTTTTAVGEAIATITEKNNKEEEEEEVKGCKRQRDERTKINSLSVTTAISDTVVDRESKVNGGSDGSEESVTL